MIQIELAGKNYLTRITISLFTSQDIIRGCAALQNQPIYLKAITLKDISDVDSIKDDAKKHMILIVRITPMAQKDIETLRKAIDDLYNFVKSVGGDIARLGEERVVITPPAVKIWKGVHDLK